MQETLTIRPYARLITMLGDQLIKNERVALAELIKNAYDADAEWVRVSFLNFGNDFSVNQDSRIIIEDNGCGMNREIIEKHWLNPATPEKNKRKRIKATTDKGRILQGEKGIGRFAVFKLGKKVEIVSRRRSQNEEGLFLDDGEPYENVVTYDFSGYDEDFTAQTEEGNQQDLFIDELQVQFQQRQPSQIKEQQIKLGSVFQPRSPYGTRIEITGLKTSWSDYRVEQIQKEVGKLQSIFSEKRKADFDVWFYKEDQLYTKGEVYREKLLECLDSKSVLKITDGIYHESERLYTFKLNGESKALSFDDLVSLDAYKRYFKNEQGAADAKYITECGNYSFQFYIFDPKATDSKFKLDSEDWKMVKEHRIYLYRDGIRVLPYGDPDDDWLRIDMMRGTISAGYYLGNDQVVGCIDISYANNPKLRDKTNREGLIDEGRAAQDFINTITLFLRYLRATEYSRYQVDKKRRDDHEKEKTGKPLAILNEVEKDKSLKPSTQKALQALHKSYEFEREKYDERIQKTENLAAVGLSVETASHDMMIVLKNTLGQIQGIIGSLQKDGVVDRDSLLKEMVSIEQNVKLVYTQMTDIRRLFPAARAKAEKVFFQPAFEKVEHIYRNAFQKNNITVEYQDTIHNYFLIVTEAVLLQVLVNLFDNALYWLTTVDRERKILIEADAKKDLIIFADNGPGVKKESENYIFEAFYSEKGKDGRGLGLYIAKQLLERYSYEIRLIQNPKEKILQGANFCIEYKGGK